MIQDTLKRRIEQKQELTQKEIESAIKIFGCYCKQKTKDKLERILNYVPNIPCYGIYGRVFIQNEIVSYCAGQSYRDEIRTVRDLLINK